MSLTWSNFLYWQTLLLLTVALRPSNEVAAQTEMQLVGHPAISPDGLTLAVDWGGDVWIGSSFGGRMRRLTAAPSRESRPVFSPDGTSIAFLSNRSGSYQVYRMPVDGGMPVQLTFDTRGARIEDWAPDGERLLISAERDHSWTNRRRLFLISASEPSQEQLLFDATARNGRLSACGSKLLFAREGVDWWRFAYRGSDAGQIWLYDLSENTFQQLSSEGTAARWPLWLTGGQSQEAITASEAAVESQQIVFASNESGRFVLALRKSDGSTTTLTDNEEESICFPAVARNESVVVFRQGFDLYRFDLDRDERPQRLHLICHDDLAHRSQLRRILRDATDVAFSSDGLEIALIAGGDLWVMDTVLREPRQVTHTAAAERSPCFAPDDQTIAFVSDQAEQSDIWLAKRADPNSYWWRNSSFEVEQITNSEATESNPQWSPSGSRIAFSRDSTELWTKELASDLETKIDTVTSSLDFDWSADGNWLCYSAKDANYNSEIYLASADGTINQINISQHFQDDYGPRWAPDGSMIAYTGYRENGTRDIFVVSLDGRNWRSRSRQMRVEAALQAMNHSRGKKEESNHEDTSAPMVAFATSDQAIQDGSADSAAGPNAELPSFSNFDEYSWRDRTERITIPDSHEYRLVWSPDSSALVYTARSQDRVDTYRLKITERDDQELLTPQTGRDIRWLKDDLIVWRSDGSPGSVDDDGEVTEYDFKAYQQIDRTDFYAAVFQECWRTIRDSFYDPNLNGVDWTDLRRDYGKMARESIDTYALAEVVKLMLGKLNASHLGFSLLNSGSGSSDRWNHRTVHLGIRYRLAEDGASLVITDVLPGSPAADWDTQLEVGESVTRVNDQEVSSAACPIQLFNQPNHLPLTVEVQGAAGETRTVTLTPIASSEIETLKYKQWTRRNREFVDDRSNGRLAYLHIRKMLKTSLRQFERELYEAASSGKVGLIVDVRDNRGGNIADHLLAMLSPGRHASTFRRGGELGYPQSRKPSVTWDQPLVVLCNQNSFSNAEIFCHGIKTLGRGTLIGTPTSGGVISTYDTTIRGVGRLRIPHRGWQVYTTGQNMDQAGATPDIRVDRELSDIVAGRDRQLERAISELLEQISNAEEGESDGSE